MTYVAEHLHLQAWSPEFKPQTSVPHTKKSYNKILFRGFFFGDTGVWTQGLHLEALHQSFFCDGIFQDRVLETICPGLALNQDPADLYLLSS
jgi:hypothetical protein